MTPQERDMLIDRYLSGGMAPSERAEFLRHAANDTELASMLRAERAVRHSLQGDRTAIPGPSTASRARFTSMLATVTAEIEGTAGTDSNETPGGTGGGTSPLRVIPGRGSMRAMIAAGSAIVLLVSAVFLVPRWMESSTTPAAPSMIAPGSSAAPAPKAAAPAATPTTVTPETTVPAAAAPETARPEPAAQPAQAGTTPREQAPARTTSARPAQHRTSTASTAAEGTTKPATTSRTGTLSNEGASVKVNRTPPDIGKP